MKKSLLLFVLCSFSAAVFNLAEAQTYVWKNGHPLVTDPDSITFVKPDLSARVDTIKDATFPTYDLRYLTKDYAGRPIWQSARLMLTTTQEETHHIGKMALYNHYTIARLDECPTAGKFDLQAGAMGSGFAVVAADYEGFGETADRWQAYCYGEANARASIDALLAAREWLVAQGYTISDTLITYGYSQGGQTTIAALKLSQTEYKGRVHFMKTIAGAGPYDLTLTYKKFLQWERLAQPVVLPMNIITTNELEQLGLNYKKVFKEPLATNVKSWILSKRFDTDEMSPLIGSDSLKNFMQPAYMDSTSAEVKFVLQHVQKQDITQSWTPDPDTEVLLVHSLNDDIVPAENTVAMHHFFIDNGVTNARIDTTSLTGTHTESGTSFLVTLLMEVQGF